MKMRNMTIMHRKYLALEQYHYSNTTTTTVIQSLQQHKTITTITVGVTAESAVTPTVIVALSVHHALIDSDSKQSLQEEEERP